MPPHASAHLAFTTAVADTREEALALADQYHEFHAVTRVFELAWAHSQVELQHLHVSAAEVHLFQRLAAHVIFAGPRLRAASFDPGGQSPGAARTVAAWHLRR